MSLKVWYQFNGNAENKGIENAELIQTTEPTYIDNGKIGKALSTGGYKWSAETTAKILNNNELSIAFWIYINADEGTSSNEHVIFGNRNMTPPDNRRFTIFLSETYNNLHWSWQNNNDNKAFTNGIIRNSIPSYEWTHVCFTYKNPNGKIYINGELIREFNGVSDSSTFAYDTQVIHSDSHRYLNDFRIYDHALSDKEVKEISKGLIAHYKLDNNSPAGIEKDVSGYGHDGVKNGDLTYSSDSPRYVGCTKFNGNNTIIINDTISSRSIESISLWLYVNETQKTECIFMGGRSNLSLCISNNKIITSCDSKLPKYMYNITDIKINDWNHIVIIKNEEYDILYVNGKEQSDNLSTIKDYYGKLTPHINIGGREITSGQSLNPYYTNKNVSDVRIYATALSEEDVKELYETSAIIDDKGNLFAYDFVEGESTDIGANGVITTPQLIESDMNTETKCQIYANKIVANQFIEL